ncbi:LLM class flavin-dependent oxidoreductase [Halalkalicoccus ordinarius]|uniref:LLM class flavin-dependent oxidoreductase n=1 Tax=Halalkalicoccus ordinarius TaxID=3116651 RepID=UPI00300F543E
MTRGVLLPNVSESASEVATRIEALGYDAIWTGELWGTDAFVQLTTLAAHTEGIALGTAIANVFSRSPAVLASAAAALEERSSGPVRLGVGASTPKAIEDLHGFEYDRPIRRMHETVELVKAYTAGDGRVEYDGECFSTRDFPALEADVSVYTAALGPAARRATGRVADGWLPHNIPFEGLSGAFETVSTAAREAGRDPEGIEVAPYVPAAVAEDTEEARGVVRGHLAYYVGSGEGYRRAVGERFPEEVDRIAEAWHAGERGRAREEVTDEMVAALGAAGTPDEARSRLSAIEGLETVDEPIVVVPSNADDATVERTIEALAP